MDAPSGAEDECRGVVWLQEGDEGGEEGGGIGVVPDEPVALHFDAIDGTDGCRHLVHGIEVRYDFLLVGEGDVEAVELVVAHPLPQVGDGGELVEAVLGVGDAFALEHILEPALRPGM